MGEIIKMIPRNLARGVSTLALCRLRPRRWLGATMALLLCISVGFLGYAQATTTTLSPDFNPSVFGQSVTFTATVAVVPETQTPSGTVTFYDGDAVLGTDRKSVV